MPFYKYLGVYFSSRLSWSKTHLMLSLQARKAMNYILRLRKHFGPLRINDMCKIFDATIKPILYYGTQIWGYQYVEKIEKAQIQFCKRLCYLSQNMCNFLALGECGRLPLCTFYIPNCIKYRLSILHMSSNRYPKQCYYMLMRQEEAGRLNWTAHVKDLLFTYGFGYAWIVQDVGNDKEFLKMFTELSYVLSNNGIQH